MVIVIPFCIKDCKSALKNIQWARELEGSYPFRVLLSYDSDVPQSQVDSITKEAERTFADVVHLRYQEWMGNPRWPNPQNYAFQTVAWQIIDHIKEPFLFWEPDAIPIRKNWANDLWRDYKGCGKPFMGHIVHGVTEFNSMHLNGVAIYPPDLHVYSTSMMIPPEGMAWDVAGADGCVQNARHSNLVMNVWEMDSGYKPVSSGGVVPTFPNQKAVDALVDFEASLFHRNKDLTLIDRLRERVSMPAKKKGRSKRKR